MNIKKAAGFCLIGTGLFAVTGFILHPHDSSSNNQIAWLIGHSFIFLALVLNLIGLTFVTSIEHKSLGLLGLFGFVLLGLGLSMYIGKLYWSGLLYPLVLAESPDLIARVGLGPGSVPKAPTVRFVYNSGAILFSLGHLLFGTALLRSRTYPAKPIWLLMLGAFMVGIWPLLPGVLQMLSIVVSAIYATGLVWFGISLTRR